MRASHILIRHEESRREASWKDPEGQVISATTRDDADARLGELHGQILADYASFADLAAQHSARPPAAGLHQRADHARQIQDCLVMDKINPCGQQYWLLRPWARRNQH
ncbi:hypothetical protein CFC21_054679 [Triticum aestivum]|uniref:Peptidyl-prolyl cis-trans isomerase n=2 Tax=Triticum aestivum TaxID=4565 RepID=A0A3B6I4N7_WHEAT|nr:hypothetical protein CFC21_054679 [Triticum aestivum]